ncbi:hypothetical protein PHLGIDRAFT_128951 [Phlebiopsis gigantea 11061_1 CR5-6]|uniref:Uncharacterized protein n=1 Tax=Phlebiopsis gigantea (strain 11061_1 CR5-6) TaxID=745531 RepID=A0A0C3S8J8_PHLG1|nr:hypothetical protein PHLGIDRAFT_128951 [Phlebiopsis gigantea 11061_1 CR5-6]
MRLSTTTRRGTTAPAPPWLHHPAAARRRPQHRRVPRCAASSRSPHQLPPTPSRPPPKRPSVPLSSMDRGSEVTLLLSSSALRYRSIPPFARNTMSCFFPSRRPVRRYLQTCSFFYACLPGSCVTLLLSSFALQYRSIPPFVPNTTSCSSLRRYIQMCSFFYPCVPGSCVTLRWAIS